MKVLKVKPWSRKYIALVVCVMIGYISITSYAIYANYTRRVATNPEPPQVSLFKYQGEQVDEDMSALTGTVESEPRYILTAKVNIGMVMVRAVQKDSRRVTFYGVEVPLDGEGIKKGDKVTFVPVYSYDNDETGRYTRRYVGFKNNDPGLTSTLP